MHLIKYLSFCLLALCSCQPAKPCLKIFTWAAYFDPGVIHEFEKENGCKVIFDIFDSNELMYAKLKSGRDGYDLLTPTLYTAKLLYDQNLIQPLDYRLLPNLAHLDTNYCDLKDFQPFGAPYLISCTGVGYVKGRVDMGNKSWAIFSDKRLRWRTTLLNDYRETLAAALIYQGSDPNLCTNVQLEQATKQIQEWKSYIAKFENEQYKLGLDSAEFLAVHAYNGDIAQIMEDNPDIGFFLPKEGFTCSADLFCIYKDCKRQELAHAFINFMQRPDIAARNIIHTRYLCPNKECYSLLPRSLRENEAIFVPAHELKKSYVILDIGEQTSAFLQAWEHAKSH